VYEYTCTMYIVKLVLSAYRQTYLVFVARLI